MNTDKFSETFTLIVKASILNQVESVFIVMN